uniref:NADH-ubiquinone oxidoreductase chain 4L n=1 Tax=Scolopendra dehaani TaxID=2609776 RepID=A0A343JML6_SCODE|nr:NAHD dehydrogenase subunit 4L [Scolopendra dehaani]
MFLGEFFVMAGGWIFISGYSHFLVMLISLEVMMLGLYTGMSMLMYMNNFDDILLIFLGFVVCESSIGLSLLVKFVRVFGSDYFSNFSSLWC